MAKVYEFNNLENQIFYQNTNYIIYYTGEPRELGIFEREWLDNLKKGRHGIIVVRVKLTF